MRQIRFLIICDFLSDSIAGGAPFAFVIFSLCDGCFLRLRKRLDGPGVENVLGIHRNPALQRFVG